MQRIKLHQAIPTILAYKILILLASSDVSLQKNGILERRFEWQYTTVIKNKSFDTAHHTHD